MSFLSFLGLAYTHRSYRPLCRHGCEPEPRCETTTLYQKYREDGEGEDSFTETFTDESDPEFRNKRMRNIRTGKRGPLRHVESKIILSTDSEYEAKVEQAEDNKSWMEFIDNLIKKKTTDTEESLSPLKKGNEEMILSDYNLPGLP